MDRMSPRAFIRAAGLGGAALCASMGWTAAAGLYADVMMEIDWSVGEITKALAASGVEDNTLVIFTSDNGPWLSYGAHAGKTPWREGKMTGFDGALRNACIMKFPGSIEAGTASAKAFSSLDLLPTLAHLAGAKLPANPVDGKNVWKLITGKARARNPHDYYPFSVGNRFQGVMYYSNSPLAAWGPWPSRDLRKALGRLQELWNDVNALMIWRYEQQDPIRLDRTHKMAVRSARVHTNSTDGLL